MLDQDCLDGFHRLSNSSAQTEAPSFAKNDSQNFAEKYPSNLGQGSTHLGQHAQKHCTPWSCGLASVFFFDRKSRLLRRVSMLWGCLSCFKDGEAFLVWHVALRLTSGPRTSSTSQVRLETSHRRIHKQPGRRRPCDQCCCIFSPDNPFLKETCFSGYLREDVLSQVASKLFETMEEGFDEFDWLRYFDGRGIRIKSPTVFWLCLLKILSMPSI